MNPERWRRIEEVFQQAADLSPDARAAYLHAACQGEPELRAEVESLLEASGLGLIAPVISEAAGELSGLSSPENQLLGPYRVLDRIGQGGMGAVYRAERADGQFEQQVAIKLIRPGVAAQGQIERFLAERRILAQLQHPHIARLLDGGMYSGAPYLVMELVEGQTIDTFCQERKLSVTEKLELFLKVCDAVQHAHSALIVHRDLKPSNILVTAEGSPKLLDFGIAKLVSEDQQATQTSAMMMTPDYASPEQVRGEAVTVATDVYSLGMVLYELLAGQRPYRLKSYSPAEIEQQVCQATIPVPSSLVEGETRLRKQVEGDLDNILLMALRKEPQRRYASVAQLAEDIRRHLRGHTVIARPDTFTYRSAKFLRRNRMPMALAALLLVTIATGIFLNLREGLRAQRRFNEVRTLANSLLTEIDPLAAGIVGTTEVRKAILDKSIAYLESLTKEAGEDADLQKELARAWHRVGDIQGHPRSPNLGLRSAALASHLKALEIEEALMRKRPSDPELRRSLATGYAHVADLHSNRGESEAAAKALDCAFAFKADLPPEAFVDIHISRSRAHFFANELQASLDILEPAFTVSTGLPDAGRAINIRYLQAVSLHYLGYAQRALETIEDGLKRIDEKYAGRALSPNEQVRFSTLREYQGIILHDVLSAGMGRPCEAAKAFGLAYSPTVAIFQADPRAANAFVAAISISQLLADAQAHCGIPGAVANAERVEQFHELAQRKPHANVNFYIALAHFQAGNLAAAKKRLADPKDDEGNDLELLAQIAAREHRKPDALKLLAQARSIREPVLAQRSFQESSRRYRQARNIVQALRWGDSTPGLRQRAEELLRIFPEQGVSPDIQRLRAQLKSL